jgi:hypothetical protein
MAKTRRSFHNLRGSRAENFRNLEKDLHNPNGSDVGV